MKYGEKIINTFFVLWVVIIVGACLVIAYSEIDKEKCINNTIYTKNILDNFWVKTTRTCVSEVKL